MNREEAINNVRSFLGQLTEECQESIRTLVPELKESKDERILNEIIEFLRCSFYVQDSGLDYEKIGNWIYWLEKQKDNKFVPRALPCSAAWFEDSEKFEQKEQKPADYDHEMWKNCEVNFEGGKKEVINNPEKYGLCKPAEWSEEDDRNLSFMIECVEGCSNGEKLSFLRSTALKYVDWLKSLRPQPHKWYIKKGHWYMCIVDKPEYGWTKGKVYQSPEDNRIETDYKGDLTNWPDREPWFRPATLSEIPDNQPHWKPSEEQMEALYTVLEHEAERIGPSKPLELANGLCDDLKKLL